MLTWVKTDGGRRYLVELDHVIAVWEIESDPAGYCRLFFREGCEPPLGRVKQMGLMVQGTAESIRQMQEAQRRGAR